MQRRRARVVDHDVGVGAGSDDALAGVEAEHASRRRRRDVDPALERDLAVDDTLVQQVHAVLDTADAVRDLREVADAELLLLLEAERAVVGRHDLEVVLPQEPPQVRLMVLVLRAQGSGADVLRAFEARRAEVILEVQVEVLRAGLAEHVRAAVARGDHLLDRLSRRHVHDVHGRARDLGELDGPMRRLLFERDRAGEAVVDRVDVAAGERLRDQHVDRRAVLGVHHDHRAVRRGLLHRPAGSARRR